MALTGKIVVFVGNVGKLKEKIEAAGAIISKTLPKEEEAFLVFAGEKMTTLREEAEKAAHITVLSAEQFKLQFLSEGNEEKKPKEKKEKKTKEPKPTEEKGDDPEKGDPKEEKGEDEEEKHSIEKLIAAILNPLVGGKGVRQARYAIEHLRNYIQDA